MELDRSMPELPEVETVRRGLVPVMEGARFTRVEARRQDLRWPLPKDFVARLEGQTVEGLGRRAKYLRRRSLVGRRPADAPRHVGSFRVSQDKGRLPRAARAHRGRTTTSARAI